MHHRDNREVQSEEQVSDHVHQLFSPIPTTTTTTTTTMSMAHTNPVVRSTSNLSPNYAVSGSSASIVPFPEEKGEEAKYLTRPVLSTT
jgi:hypothetical protein